MKVNIGISYSERIEIAGHLKHLLADTYTLQLQTHNFHWNVTGPMFSQLHALFELQYSEMATAVDEIAERIRALDVAAPGTYALFAKLTSIREVEGVPQATEMVSTLVQGHEQIVRSCRAWIKDAQEADDESSLSLLSDRMRFHEKTAWMLRSMLGE